MIENFGLDPMKENMRDLINKRKLAYYGILTNCRDTLTGEYKKEVMLYHPAEKSPD